MWINKREVTALSENIRKIIDGHNIDIRDNQEGLWSILKNDIHTLADLKNEQVQVLEKERDLMQNTLANISHQIKTPLTSLMMMADLLEDAPPEKQAEFLSNIKMGLTRMDWLATALLKMAKLDAKAVTFVLKEVSISELVHQALVPLEIILELKGQVVKFDSLEVSDLLNNNNRSNQVNSMVNLTLSCDPTWTAEALTNLIKNASEYSPENSIISINSGENPISAWISVTDSGNGIPLNQIPGLFKRFEGSRSEKGFGIGLPLAQSIMHNQNGEIQVQGGGNGIGATFMLKFFKTRANS